MVWWEGYVELYFTIVTSEDQVLRRKVLILGASMEADRHLYLVWKNLW
jgi:hypothetical protein